MARPGAAALAARERTEATLNDVEPPALEVDEIRPGDLVPMAVEPELVLTPGRRLLLAMVDQALADLADRDERVREDARAWFLDGEAPAGGLSYPFVAEHLGLDVADVRRRLDELAGGVGARRRGSRAAWRAPRAARRGARRGVPGRAERRSAGSGGCGRSRRRSSASGPAGARCSRRERPVSYNLGMTRDAAGLTGRGGRR